MVRVMFTVYRRFFDEIKAGTKNIEYRQDKKPWTSYLDSQPTEAIFVCGRDRLTREITGVCIGSGGLIEFHLRRKGGGR